MLIATRYDQAPTTQKHNPRHKARAFTVPIGVLLLKLVVFVATQ